MAGTKAIVVLQRGWVVVGDVSREGDLVVVDNASVVRRWGTKNGLGELAEKGKQKETVLDSCPQVRVHQLGVVLHMACNQEAWK